MLNIVGRGVLFVSSYAPLFLILGIRAWDSSQPAACTFVAVGVASVILTGLLVGFVDTLGPTPVHVLKAESKSGETTGYLVTYVLPFLSLGSSSPADLVSLAVLLLTFGLVFVNSELVLVNPVLAVMRYHLFDIEVDEGQHYLVISRAAYPPKPGSDLSVRRLGPGFAKVV
jgi:hypothetical protein